MLRELAARHGTDVNSIALANLCSQPLPTIPIIGASSAVQLRASIAAAEIPLEAAGLQRLRDA